MQKKSASRPQGRRRQDAHRREIERLVREFLSYADLHPLHRFAAGTRRFIVEIRPIVSQLDSLQRRRS